MPDLNVKLYYFSETDLLLLPEWAYFFIRLGYQLAEKPKNNHRFVIGVAIPSRAFASSLVSLGALYATVNKGVPVDEARWQYISTLEPGTPIYIRKKKRKLKGVVKSIEDINGKKYISIYTTSDTSRAKALTRSYPLIDYVSKITVIENEISLPGKQSGRQLNPPNEFIQAYLGEDIADEYVHSSSFEVLIIGKKTVIKEEVTGNFFACQVPNENRIIEGNLQEILRIDQFLGENRSYRTQCFSSSTNSYNELNGQTPNLVIFDGAIAYLNQYYNWGNVHQVVLLDRTERQFQEAVDLLNDKYAYRSEKKAKFSISIPTNIEMMIYLEETRE
jgi:hypothetical protein